MSKPSDSPQPDIESTDELPRLDVAAYEAGLAQGQDDFGARTDTWTVEALQQIDAAADTKWQERARGSRRLPPPPAGGVTNDVNQILQRIAELESELAAAKTANVQLQSRHDALAAQRDEQMRLAASFEAENERLREHRTLADEMLERLEQKLRDQAAQLANLQAAQSAGNLKEHQAREELQRQVAQKAAQLAALQGEHDKLREELHSSNQLAAQREESLLDLRALLIEEETSSGQLALQLASKLREHDVLSSLIDARNHTIAELRTQADDINMRWQRTLENFSELSAQLDAANSELAQSRDHISLRDTDLTSQQQRLAQSAAEIQRLTAELQTVSQQRDALTQTLSSHQQAQGTTQQQLVEQAQQISELRATLDTEQASAGALQRHLDTALSELSEVRSQRQGIEELLGAEQLNADGLRAGLEFARTQLQQLSDERDSLLALREQAAERAAALQQSEQLLTDALRDVGVLHGELSTQSEHLSMLKAQLASARDQADELRRDRDTSTQALQQERQATQDALAEAQSNFESVQAKTAELAALRLELERQGPALRDLEHTVSARDELIEHLRHQLKTLQDEHAIMSGQLQKARLRVKSLAEQIFQRDNQVAALKSDLAVHVEALAAIRRDVNRVDEDQPGYVSRDPRRVLEPVGHDNDPILLDRKVITVGRTSENDVCVPSKLVSRHHARLLVGPNGVIVEDAGSTNGCFVNGKQVKQQLMRDGDLLELGDMRYRLSSPSLNDTRIRDNVVAFAGKNDGKPIEGG